MFNNRAGNHKGQHSTDGPAGQDKVNQFWRRYFGLLWTQGDDGGIDRAGEEAQGENWPRHMCRCSGVKDVHQNRSQTSQYGQDTLQIKEAKNKAECPHADHVRHPEVTYQRACVVQAHAQAFGIFRHPGDKT